MTGRRSPIALIALVVLTVSVLVVVSCQGSDAGPVVIGSTSSVPVVDTLVGAPTANEHGITVGWPRSAEGAAGAAASYVRASALVATAGPLERRDVVASIATVDFAPSLLDSTAGELDELLFAVGEQGLSATDLVWGEYPLSIDQQPVSDDEVRLRVWSVLMLGATGGSVARQSWRTSTMTLRWEGDDWKVDAWSSEAGPTPVATGEAGVSTVDEVAGVVGWDPVVGAS